MTTGIGNKTLKINGENLPEKINTPLASLML
jgi:hypothetical protein